MALRQQLIQKLEQRLSPQQIQLMKLLQVPTMELDQRIKQELEENPALEEGQEIWIGKEKLAVIFVPGHSPGHVVFYHSGSKQCIAGDTLFKGSIGRTDLPGGNHNLLLNKIKSQLFALPDETVVYPGHGPETTIGFEKIKKHSFLIFFLYSNFLRVDFSFFRFKYLILIKKMRLIIFAFTLVPCLAFAGTCKVIDISDGDTFTCFTDEKKTDRSRKSHVEYTQKIPSFRISISPATSD